MGGPASASQRPETLAFCLRPGKRRTRSPLPPSSVPLIKSREHRTGRLEHARRAAHKFAANAGKFSCKVPAFLFIRAPKSGGPQHNNPARAAPHANAGRRRAGEPQSPNPKRRPSRSPIPHVDPAIAAPPIASRITEPNHRAQSPSPITEPNHRSPNQPDPRSSNNPGPAQRHRQLSLGASAPWRFTIPRPKSCSACCTNDLPSRPLAHERMRGPFSAWPNPVCDPRQYACDLPVRPASSF